MNRMVLWTVIGAALVNTLAVPSASAQAPKSEKSKVEIDARIYTKWLYRNDDTQGVLWLGNPFWPDDIAGNNGVASEVELIFKGQPSKWVKAGFRLQSRFGGMWQDWWESGEAKPGYQGEHNTSGDSLGMNRAQYVKFRGFHVHIKPDVKFVDWIKVGATDLSMFNPWTIGKIRYIDRDNARAVTFQGGLADYGLSYFGGAIALPKLWVGPGWSTGIGDDKLDDPYISQDWAYALKIDYEFPGAMDWLKATLVGSYTRDVEFDPWDPDAKGSLTAGCVDELGAAIPNCTEDHAVATYPRYRNAVATAEFTAQPGDVLYANLLVGYSHADTGERFVTNGVAENGGMFPVIYGDADDYAVQARVTVTDPFDVGVSFKAEYFNIGPDWTSVFATRREADVLLTDGFISGGQLPTLNLANEFVDFDEPWFESCVGWHGGTLIALYQNAGLEASLEGTFLSYNTNMQRRDVDTRYPTFLYSEGYTDTDLYDYANVTDRGRDPRSVYKRDQDRQTIIAVGKLAYVMPFGLKLEGKFKFIQDDDWRQIYHRDSEGDDVRPRKLNAGDDYLGSIYQARFEASMPVTETITVALGSQYDYWDEQNRSGDPSGGYGDYTTNKVKGFMKWTYRWGGASAGYVLEYVHKDQDRPDSLNLKDQLWDVWRSKATLEVAW